MQAVVYGKHVITHLLNSHQEKLQEIYLSKEIDKKFFFRAQKKHALISSKWIIKKRKAWLRGGIIKGF
ncbi:hypothetical protein BXP20_03630 [Helicobacter pylori]|nr:hypothetical protein BXP20_03630 [Helicobacter pylori]